MESSAYITLKDVVFSRGGRRIFDGVTLDIPKGKITAIMGPSGTGKTTLLRLIGGQLRPDSGQVTVDGDYAYFGYMYGPEGTTIMDISDPRKPKTLITLMLEDPQTHSHKVRVVGDIMVVNSE